MKKTFTRMLLVSAPLILLQGCEWADDLGRHMPVIGERCENWQCFTSSGQAQSEATKRSLEAQKRTPINPQQQPQQATPQAQPQPQQEKARTPYDMTPEELNDMPSPYSNSSY